MTASSLYSPKCQIWYTGRPSICVELINELICMTDKLYCNMSKILRVIQPRSRFPLQSSRADLPLAKGTISSQLQEPLALNDTCKASCVPINVRFQSPLCELVAGWVLWPPTCLPKALFTCWTLLHVRHATCSRTKEPALPSPGLRKCNIINPWKTAYRGKDTDIPSVTVCDTPRAVWKMH